MPDHRQFTIEEANSLLPEVMHVTNAAAKRFAEFDGVETNNEDAALAIARRQQSVAEEWAHAVIALGVHPKGLFVVDFVSRGDPSVLFCWAYGEPRVAHQHRDTESFDERVPVPGWDLSETVQ